MDLKSLDLLSLQPPSLRSDPSTIALCKAFEPVFQRLADGIKLIMIYTNLEHLSEALLDEMAWALHVEWYNANDSLAAKRQTIKRSLDIHRRKGTAAALKDAVDANFGDARVEEWYEYGGEPYHFIIYIEDPAATTEKAMEFLRIVDSVKNARSVLELVVLLETEPAPLYMGCATYQTDIERVSQING